MIANETRFPWYDGYWLECFARAKRYLSVHRPDALQLLLNLVAPARTNPEFTTTCLRSLLDEAELAYLRQVIAGLKPSQLELHEIKRFGRWVVHDHPILNEFQDRMTPLVEDLTGEAVEPSYSFLSMYTRLGRCPLHQDAPYAKWTLDICIDQSGPWPIHFSQVREWPEDQVFPESGWEESIMDDPANRFTSQLLLAGDAVLFSGSSQWHYRDPIATMRQDPFCHLIFFHFIPRAVTHCLDPADWEACLDVPGLSAGIGHPVRKTFGRR